MSIARAQTIMLIIWALVSLGWMIGARSSQADVDNAMFFGAIVGWALAGLFFGLHYASCNENLELRELLCMQRDKMRELEAEEVEDIPTLEAAEDLDDADWWKNGNDMASRYG